MPDNEPNEHSVEIAREKTKRTYAWLGLLGILAVLTITLFFQRVGTGSLSVDAGGIEVTIDKPLIEQVEHSEQQIVQGDDTLMVTTSAVSDTLIEKIEQELGGNNKLPSDEFVGKNLIDRKEGFVLSSKDPDTWSIKRDVPISTAEGAHVSAVKLKSKGGAIVWVESYKTSEVKCQDIKCYARQLAGPLTYEQWPKPTIDIDNSGTTAVVKGTNIKGTALTHKLILQDDTWYIATGVVPLGTPKEEAREALTTVLTFSAIEKTGTGTRSRR